MKDKIIKCKFKEINLEDNFFNSLKKDYIEFCEWFNNKGNEEAYLFYEELNLIGFLYLKIEEGEVLDVQPQLPSIKRLKIGTFKIIAHGTKLGERFLKKSIDHAIFESVSEIYITIFPKYTALISLLKDFGFKKKGVKTTKNGVEHVFVKDLTKMSGNLRKDYPNIDGRGRNKFLLSIYPEWHTQLFPDSILNNENYNILKDVSHTNSIQKTYVCFMDLSELRSGDILIIYRTKDSQGPAWYRSVVTSICTVEEVRSKASFENQNDYIDFTEKFSIFNKIDLNKWWNKGDRLYVIKMLYNAAFSKRLIRKDLVEMIGLNDKDYWGFLNISNEQYKMILSKGGICERIVVN